MDTFEKFKTYLRQHNVADIVTRKEILSKKFGQETTIDNYRLHFTGAGYLEIVGRGQYKIIKEIPKDILVRDLKKKHILIGGLYGVSTLIYQKEN